MTFLENSTEIKNAIEFIKIYFDKHDVINNMEDYENLHWDYTRMFIGPLALPAPPWESVYVRKDQLLFQEIMVAVQRKYEESSFVLCDQNMEAEDHVDIELDFMFHLNKLCIDIIEKTRTGCIKSSLLFNRSARKISSKSFISFYSSIFRKGNGQCRHPIF